MAYLLAAAKVTIFRRICSAGMKNVISRFARGGLRGELNDNRAGRHRAMGVNADATTLIKLMDIGTPTNVSQAQ